MSFSVLLYKRRDGMWGGYECFGGVMIMNSVNIKFIVDLFGGKVFKIEVEVVCLGV